MIYLIDGHNLIGKMPDIDLADPDDEQKLVYRLRDWIQLHSRRDVQVYFDAGEFGGVGNLNSVSRLKIQFARVGRTADELLIKAIRKLNNPQEYTLVTSDREIIYAAKQRRVGYILSEEFAAMLAEALQPDLEDDLLAESRQAEPGAELEPEVSDGEVENWIDIFDKAPLRASEDHIVPTPDFDRTPQAKRHSNPTHGSKDVGAAGKEKEIDPQRLKAGEDGVTEADLEDWLALFGGDAQEEKYKHEAPVVVERPDEKKKKPRQARGEPRVRKHAEDNLSTEEVDAWLDLFRHGPDKKS